MAYLLVFFSSLIATLFLTPYLIIYLKRSKIVDIPSGRRIHQDVIPRMGGVIIFFVVMGMLSAFSEDLFQHGYLLISVSILIICGILDDINGLNSYIKFIFQIISAVFVLLYLNIYFESVMIFGIDIPQILETFIVILFIVGGINSINLLDGLDGLASGFSLLIFSIILALSVISNNSLLIFLSVSLIGSILGFLKYNAFPARIFLGDSGSLVLGFFLVVTSIMISLSYTPGVLDLTFPIMLLAVPILDTMKVMLKRIIQKKNPFHADNNHLHYIIFRNNVKHEITVFIIEIFSVAFIFISLMYLKGYHYWSIVAFFILAFLLVYLKPAIVLIKKLYDVRDFFSNLIHNFPFKNTDIIKEVFISTSTALMVIIILFSFPIETTLTYNSILFVTIACITLILLAYFQQYKSKVISHINVFLNFSIFFILSELSLPSGSVFLSSSLIFTDFHFISFGLLGTLLLIFIFGRGRLVPKGRILLTGIDLTMISLIAVTFIVNRLLDIDLSYYLSICLLQGFIFYLWYKIIFDIKSKLALYISHLSFFLPLVSLVILLIK